MSQPGRWQCLAQQRHFQSPFTHRQIAPRKSLTQIAKTSESITVSDPIPWQSWYNAFYTDNHDGTFGPGVGLEENADKCNSNFGTIFPAKNGADANVRFGSKDFRIQTNFAPIGAVGKCLMFYPTTAIPANCAAWDGQNCRVCDFGYNLTLGSCIDSVTGRTLATVSRTASATKKAGCPSQSASSTAPRTSSQTASPSPSLSSGVSASKTQTAAKTGSITRTPVRSMSSTISNQPTFTTTSSSTPTGTLSASKLTGAATRTRTFTPRVSRTASATNMKFFSRSRTPTISKSSTKTPSITPTSSKTPTNTPSTTKTSSITGSIPRTRSVTATSTRTSSHTPKNKVSLSNTPTTTRTPSNLGTPPPTVVPSGAGGCGCNSGSFTGTGTCTGSISASASTSASASASNTAEETFTFVSTATAAASSATSSVSQTPGPLTTPSRTNTASRSANAGYTTQYSYDSSGSGSGSASPSRQTYESYGSGTGSGSGSASASKGAQGRTTQYTYDSTYSGSGSASPTRLTYESYLGSGSGSGSATRAAGTPTGSTKATVTPSKTYTGTKSRSGTASASPPVTTPTSSETPVSCASLPATQVLFGVSGVSQVYSFEEAQEPDIIDGSAAYCPGLGLSDNGKVLHAINLPGGSVQAGGTLLVSLCSADTSFDTTLWVGDTCPTDGSASFDCLVGDDDSQCGTASTVSLTTSGSTGLYYVLVSSFAAGANGTYRITWSYSGPPSTSSTNSPSVSATASPSASTTPSASHSTGASASITPTVPACPLLSGVGVGTSGVIAGQSFVGSTAPVMVSGTSCPGFNVGSNGKALYELMIPGGTIEGGTLYITLCGANFDTTMWVGDTCPTEGAGFDCLAGDDDSQCGTASTITLTTSVSAGVFYVLVSSYVAGVSGNFDLQWQYTNGPPTPSSSYTAPWTPSSSPSASASFTAPSSVSRTPTSTHTRGVTASTTGTPNLCAPLGATGHGRNGSFLFQTLDASSAPVIVDSSSTSCPGLAMGSYGKLLYAIVLPNTTVSGGALALSTCGAAFDVAMWVGQNCPGYYPTYNCLLGNENGCPSDGGVGAYLSVSVPAAGVQATYYVLVSSEFGGFGGVFNLTWSYG